MNVACDLVLLSWNHLDVTKPCLESLFRATRVPVRLFIVDNGSTPEVRAFLQGVTPQGIRRALRVYTGKRSAFPLISDRTSSRPRPSIIVTT